MSGADGHVWRLDRDGKVSVHRKGAGTNGLLFDAEGRLLACEPRLRRVTRTEADGRLTVLTDQFRKNGMVLELVAALLHENCVIPVEGAGISTQNVRLDRIIEHIMSHPAEKLDMKTAAAMANMSYFAFSRKFKSAVGLNFSDYCNLLRIRFAEDKLISTDMPISDIAAEIGIDTPSYFSRLFRNTNGISPQEFRNRNRSR